MTFYRFHWADAPALSAADAWSALWGTERTGDGSQTICTQCNGKGKVFEYDDDCDTCNGEGVEDCARGYSAFEDADELIRYFVERGQPADSAGQVVVFEGTRIGNGPDGEALAVPTQIVRSVTWSEFSAQR